MVGLGEERGVRYQNLSGGQQQRLSVAIALAGAPPVMLLDELTTGLDPRARRTMWDMVRGLRADGVTVLLVSHLMEEIERLCDRVALLEAGRVVAAGTLIMLANGMSAQLHEPIPQAGGRTPFEV